MVTFLLISVKSNNLVQVSKKLKKTKLKYNAFIQQTWGKSWRSCVNLGESGWSCMRSIGNKLTYPKVSTKPSFGLLFTTLT